MKNRESRERLENRPRRQNMAPLREESRRERCTARARQNGRKDPSGAGMATGGGSPDLSAVPT